MILAIVWVCCAGLGLAGELLKLDKLTLNSGREYEKVIVLEKEVDGIKISHHSHPTGRLSLERKSGLVLS